MMRSMLAVAAISLVCVALVNAQQRNIDAQKSTLIIHVGKTGTFSALGHEHEIHAPIHRGTADTGADPAVEIHVNAGELRVMDKGASEKERAHVRAGSAG
jgi:hypothetical protein